MTGSGSSAAVRPILLLSLALTGCAVAPTGWLDPAPAVPDAWAAPDPGWTAELKAFERADSADAVAAVIENLDRRVAAGQADVKLLTTLAEAHVLYGAAWAEGRKSKRHHFDQAASFSQLALLTQLDFAEALIAGERPGAAADHLPRDAVPAMVIWVTATAYRFEETMGPIQRARNFRQMDTARQFMQRAMLLDPEYEFGVVPFSLAIFHIATPAFAGGDRALAAELLEQAIATPGVSLLPRWGRARYLHPIHGDREAMRQDLEWVLAQDPHAADSAYRWNVYWQTDARRMLERMN